MQLLHSKRHSLRLRYILFLLILTSFGDLVYAQSTEIGLWTGVNLEKSFGRSLALHLNGQFRFRDNLATRSASLGELGLSYKLNKRWELTGYYRYISRRKWDSEVYTYRYRPYHRFYGDLSYDQKWWKLKFDYRLRYQHQFKDDVNDPGQDKSYLRNKLEVSYPSSTRFRPYLSTDVFYRLGTGFDQLRNKAGVNIEITKRQSVDLYGFSNYQLIERQENRVTFGVIYRLKL